MLSAKSEARLIRYEQEVNEIYRARRFETFRRSILRAGMAGGLALLGTGFVAQNVNNRFLEGCVQTGAENHGYIGMTGDKAHKVCDEAYRINNDGNVDNDGRLVGLAEPFAPLPTVFEVAGGLTVVATIAVNHRLRKMQDEHGVQV